VADVLEENGISINLLPIPNDSPADPAGVAYAVVDGFLAICAGDTHPGVIAARRRGIPVVLTVASGEGGDFVTIDEPAAGRALGSHLAELGHRDVVVVVDLEDAEPDGEWVGRTGVEDLVRRYRQIGWVDSAERLRGLAEGLGDAQVSFVSAGTNSVACAVASTRLVLRERPSATAVVAVSDLMALAVVDELTSAGIDVAREVSVAGFDGIDAALAAELTTIGQPIVEKGRRAAQLLLDPDARERQVFLPSRLVVGRTTGPAPRR
jgi:DNA-binding LacI/PurR family transcriptional regulator